MSRRDRRRHPRAPRDDSHGEYSRGDAAVLAERPDGDEARDEDGTCDPAAAVAGEASAADEAAEMGDLAADESMTGERPAIDEGAVAPGAAAVEVAAADDGALLRRLLDASPEGVVLVDAREAEHRVVFVNAGFQLLTGYTSHELIGRNLRFLQGGDLEQEGRHRLREAQRRGESCRVLLRNYRKDGTMFWNEISIVPLLGADGKLSHYAGYHRNAGERLRSEPRAAREAAAGAAVPPPPGSVAIREDRLTGLFTLPYLDELLTRDWASAQRERRSVAIFSIDIDALNLYNTTFGRAAGDSTIRRVAHCVAGCLRRASDVTARVEGGRLIAYAPGLAIEPAMRIGQVMAERVRDMRIHHPRSVVLRYVSISVGVAAAVPDGDSAAVLMRKSLLQLELAKKSGRNQAA